MYTDEGLNYSGHDLYLIQKKIKSNSTLFNDEETILRLIEDIFRLKRKLEDGLCVCCGKLRSHDRKDCPTFYDGCNCGADVVENLCTRNLELEAKLKQAEKVLSAKPWEHKEDGDV